MGYSSFEGDCGQNLRPKVGIVTYHHVNNYGSVLQAYATQEVLRSLGCSPAFIDYVNSSNRDDALLKTMVLDSGYADSSFLKKAAFTLASMPDVKNSTRLFEDFRKRYLNLTERCYTCEDCARIAEASDFDAFCTGSDQVWNMHSSKAAEGVDPVFFLAFAPEESYRFSLSASLGVSKLTEEESRAYRAFLTSYNSISVREPSSIELLGDIGVDDVAHVIDPTLLLGPDAWRDFGQETGLPEDYVLVYQLHSDERLWSFAREAAAFLGVPVIRVSFFWRNWLKDRHIWYLPRPEKLVSAFDNASLVVTDSFHGTAFSSQLNTPFVSFAPRSFSGRIVDHLDSLGLSSRLYDGSSSVESYLMDIEWEKPNQMLCKLRSESLAWIDGVVKSIGFAPQLSLKEAR